MVVATSTIRFATFLSPIMYTTYEHIARYVGAKMGCPTSLSAGQSFEEFAEGHIDVAFICGLPYVRMTRWPSCPVELLAAPVLLGERYQHKPVYYSDVIVVAIALIAALTIYRDACGPTMNAHLTQDVTWFATACSSAAKRLATLERL